MGKLKTCREVGLAQVYTKSEGPPATGPGTIQPQPNGGFGATVPTVPNANLGNLGGGRPAPTSSLGSGGASSGGSALSGGGAKPGGFGLSPPVAPVAPVAPKLDEAALRSCKLFLGRKDELLCSEARSFAACKAAVDAGGMKTCRLTNTQEVYPKR